MHFSYILIFNEHIELNLFDSLLICYIRGSVNIIISIELEKIFISQGIADFFKKIALCLIDWL